MIIAASRLREYQNVMKDMAWKLSKEQFITNYPFLSLVSYFGWLLLIYSWQHSCNNLFPKYNTLVGRRLRK